MWKISLWICVLFVVTLAEPPACGHNRVLREEEGVIRSHGSFGRGNYTHKMKCNWVIVGRPGKVVRLRFEAFNVEKHSRCDFDNLTVYDGPTRSSKMVKELCGNHLPTDIYSSGQNLTLWFITDQGVSGKGFQLRYKLIDTQPSGCGGHRGLHKEEDVIISHTSAGRSNYSDNLNCMWIVTGRPGKVVHLQFKVFDLQKCSGCGCDSLIAYDGSDDTTNEIQTLCGSDLPADIYSSSQNLTLRFKSDGRTAGKGFQIRYKLLDSKPSGCGRARDLYWEEGVIFSHGSAGRSNYPNNRNCSWIVMGRPGKVVRLYFDVFDLQKIPGCKNDSLTVYDGPDDTSKVMARLCGFDLPTDIYSSGQRLTLKFKSDASIAGKGFLIRYKVISEPTGCGRDVELPAEEGVILSHPTAIYSNYSNNLNFNWIIMGRPGKVVRLHFDIFSLERSSGCLHDSLTVYDGPDDTSKVMARLCGFDLPTDIYSNRQNLTLKFKSDASIADKGFLIRYKVINAVPIIITSPPSGETPVGTLLRCVADGSPPARVTLRMQSDGVCREVATGVNSTEYRLPMSTSVGNWTVRCVANNSVGRDEKTAAIAVKKLPLPVVLDIGESPLNVTEQRNISCGTERPDVDLDYLRLYFSTQEVYIWRRKDRKEVEIFTMIRGFTKVTSFPHTEAGVTILRPPIFKQAIEVTLTATPRHNGCTVTCSGYSEANKGKEGRKTKRIQVRWSPAVRRLSVHGSDGPRSPVTAHKPATIRCELHRGELSRAVNAAVALAVGGRDLGAPLVVDDKVDRDGYKWKLLTWVHQFRRADNGTRVVCGLDGTQDQKSLAVNVHYKPRSLSLSPSREVFAGESVNCSAEGNPPPSVTMEGFGNNTARGAFAASLAVPAAAKGRYEVKCSAENDAGSEATVTGIFVHKKRIPVAFKVSQGGLDVNSTVTLRCEPRSADVSLSSVNLTFAGGQQVFWKDRKVHNTRCRVLRQDFDEDRKSLTAAVQAAPFMRGKVECRLESTDFSSVGVEERQIELKWRAELRRIFTHNDKRKERGWMKEGDTLTVTCEVEGGYPPTKERVKFLGREMKGQRAIGTDLLSNGWTFRNVSMPVQLTWQHDGEAIGCSLGGKSLMERLNVEYAPRNLVIGPSLVVTRSQAVRCTASGKPTPLVKIRPVNPQAGWEEISGNGTAELRVGKNVEERSYALECEAKNRHGQEKRITAVFVQLKPVRTGNSLPSQRSGQ